MVSYSAKSDRRTKQHTQFGVSASNGSRNMAPTKVAEKRKKKKRKKKNEHRQNYKASPTGIANNAESTGKQEREGMNEPKLPGTPVCKGMVTSLMDDVTVREQDWERSLDALVARRCERMRSRLCSFTEQGCRKVVTGYNKVITIITFYWLLITQVLKGITSSRRCERKSTVGNSARLPSSTSVQDYESYTFYSVLECLGDLLRYRLMFMLFLIIHGLFKQYEVIKDENKEIWQFMNTLTFRLVAVKLGYVTYYSVTFLETFVIWIGNTGTTFMEEISYCCRTRTFGLLAVCIYIGAQ